MREERSHSALISHYILTEQLCSELVAVACDWGGKRTGCCILRCLDNNCQLAISLGTGSSRVYWPLSVPTVYLATKRFLLIQIEISSSWHFHLDTATAAATVSLSMLDFTAAFEIIRELSIENFSHCSRETSSVVIRSWKFAIQEDAIEVVSTERE